MSSPLRPVKLATSTKPVLVKLIQIRICSQNLYDTDFLKRFLFNSSTLCFEMKNFKSDRLFELLRHVVLRHVVWVISRMYSEKATKNQVKKSHDESKEVVKHSISVSEMNEISMFRQKVYF